MWFFYAFGCVVIVGGLTYFIHTFYILLTYFSTVNPYHIYKFTYFTYFYYKSFKIYIYTSHITTQPKANCHLYRHLGKINTKNKIFIPFSIDYTMALGGFFKLTNKSSIDCCNSLSKLLPEGSSIPKVSLLLTCHNS